MVTSITLSEYIKADGIPQKTAIRQAFEKRLSEIRKVNGFWNDATVYNFNKRRYNDEYVKYPYIEVNLGEIGFKNAVPDSIQMQNGLVLRCVISISEENDYLTQLEALEEDVLQCLFPKKLGMQSGAFNTLNCELTSVYHEARAVGDTEASVNFIVTFNTSILTK